MTKSSCESYGYQSNNSRKGRKTKRLGALRLTVIVFGCLVCCPLAAISSANYLTMWQDSALQKDLDAVKADFVRGQPHKDSAPDWIPSQLRHVVADRNSSKISTVRILEGDATDDQLGFLKQMNALETLEISSNLATDQTLAIISKLPKLKYLTLIGNKFSAVGLLKLRALEHLEQIRLNVQQFSAIELAVLRTEFPGVKLADSSDTFGRAYRDLEVVQGSAA